MKFKIICSFRGFVGNKAVIGQECKARLVYYHTDITRDLKESQGLVMSMQCQLDDDGDIWIKSVEHANMEEGE